MTNRTKSLYQLEVFNEFKIHIRTESIILWLGQNHWGNAAGKCGNFPLLGQNTGMSGSFLILSLSSMKQVCPIVGVGRFFSEKFIFDNN